MEFLLSVPTALLFDSCPILYSASSPHAHPRGKKNAHNSRNLHFTLHHACERTSKGSTYRLPHSYEHGQKTIVCFFLHFFFVCCFCISFGRHSIDIYPGRFSDTMRVHLFAQFVCSPWILCLCAHKHKSASAPLLSLEKVPFHLFPPTCLKRGGGRDWDIETHRTDSKYTQNTAMMESTGCRNGFYSLVAAPYKMLLSLKHQ